MPKGITSLQDAQTYLTALASADKKDVWIRDDFTIKKRSKISRFFWKIFGKSSKLRKWFFHVDLEKTKKNLEGIKAILINNHQSDALRQKAFTTYKQALVKFNQLFPAHNVSNALLQEIEDYLNPAPPMGIVINPIALQQVDNKIKASWKNPVTNKELKKSPLKSYTVEMSDDGLYYVNVKRADKHIDSYVFEKTATGEFLNKWCKSITWGGASLDDDADVESVDSGQFYKKVYPTLGNFVLSNAHLFKDLVVAAVEEDSDSDSDDEDLNPVKAPAIGGGAGLEADVANAWMKNTSRDAAYAKLNVCDLGTYLIRVSDVDPDSLIVNYLGGTLFAQSIQEFRLKKEMDGTYMCSTNQKSYASIEALIAENKQLLKKPINQPAGGPKVPDGKDMIAGVKKDPVVFKKDPVVTKPATPEPLKPAVNTGKWDYAESVRTAVAGGGDIQGLLALAVADMQPEAALWLIQKGASLDKVILEGDANQALKDLCAWLKEASKIVALTPVNLDHFALNVGYGYKSANLLMLQQKTNEINVKLKSAVVKVPPFLPISDFEMRSYLAKSVPQLGQLWKEFLNSFDKDLKKKFLQRGLNDPAVALKISDEGKAIIEHIKKLVSEHFEKNCYRTLQIDEWLTKEKPDLLIVRSTGKEDTENNSNAGGNDSIPFIEPDPLKISTTIGRVLASYFGEKSVGQRLLAGDKSLFEQETPFLPVLLQTMVMESGVSADHKITDPLNVPRSGVLFTTQKDKAKGVTFIQTGLGNNEGVVSSQVAVDSYFVNTDGHVHAVVRDKKTRFVRQKMANGKYEAAQVENDDREIQRGQALPTAVVKDLKKVADAVSVHYSTVPGEPKPLDMEYSVKMKEPKAGTDKPVIYLLQARPLLSAEAKSTPSYLDLQKLSHIPAAQRMNVNVLIDIRGTVRSIENTEEVIFADSLPKALDAYMKSDPKKIKAIFVKKSAPSTSHESVVLRPKGVAVIHVPDAQAWKDIEEKIAHATASHPVKIDTQRGLLVSTAGVNNSDALVNNGLISYPAPREVSVPLAPVFKRIYASKNFGEFQKIVKREIAETNELYQAVIESLRGEGAIPNAMLQKPFPELFDIMAMGKEKESKLALAALLVQLHAKVNQNLHEVEAFRAKYNIPLFNIFHYALSLSWKEISPAMRDAAPQSMERLYPLKFLEAALYQQPTPDVIAADSFALAMHVDKKQREGIQAAEKLKIKVAKAEDLHILQILQYGSEGSLNENTAKLWEVFAKEAQSKLSTNEIEQLKKNLEELQNLQLLPIWLSLHFTKEWKPGASKTILQSLTQLMKDNKATFDWVKKNSAHLPSAEQIPHFGEPAYAVKEIPKLKKLFLENFGFGLNAADPIKTRYEKATPFGRIAVLQFFSEAVTTYDTIIKQISGSAQFPDNRKEQAKCFAMILEGYFEMMETSILMIPKGKEHDLMKPTMGSFMPFADYVSKLRNGWTYKFGFNTTKTSTGFNTLKANAESMAGGMDAKEQFIARNEFNVSSMVIGSKIDYNFSVIWPTRLEEYFTTFHQNMEQVRNVLITETGMNSDILSVQAKAVAEGIQKEFGTTLTFNPGNKEDKTIQVVFQVPLRQHAGVLVVKYDPKAPEAGVDITLKMSGNHEHNRWYQGAFVGAWLGNSPGLALSSNVPPAIDWQASNNVVQSVEFTIHVDPKYAKTDKLISVMRFAMKSMTMGSTDLGTVIGELDKVGTVKELNPEFFAATLFGVEEVLDRIQQSKDYTKLAQGIEQAVIGVMKNNAFGTELGKKAVAAIRKHVQTLVANAPEDIKPGLTALCAKSELKKQSSDLWNFLANENAKLLPAAEVFAQAIQKGDLQIAINVAHKAKDQNMRQQAIAATKKLSEDAIIALYKALDFNAKPAFMAQYLPELSADIQAAVQTEIQKANSREAQKAALPANIDLLFQKLPNFNSEMAEVVRLCTQILIGAAQVDGFRDNNANQQFDQFLTAYLNKPKYAYIWDNRHSDTRKLRKGIPLLLIKCMESNWSDKPLAMAAVKTLIDDYLDHGQFSANKEDLKMLVYALSKGYFDNSPDKDKARAELKAMWRNDQRLLGELSNQHSFQGTPCVYNINFTP